MRLSSSDRIGVLRRHLWTVLGVCALCATSMSCTPSEKQLGFADAPLGPSCENDTDCDTGDFCSVIGNCIADGICMEHGDCPGHQMCTGNRCEPRPPCDQPDGFCNEGYFCSAGGDCLVDGVCGQDADCGELKCSAVGSCIPQDSCLALADCEAGHTCNAGSCEINGPCGNKPVTATLKPAQLLILLDRSCSMSGNKWQQARNALTTVVTEFGTKMRWGVAPFPDTLFTVGDTDSQCGQDAPLAVDLPDESTTCGANPLSCANYNDMLNFAEFEADSLPMSPRPNGASQGAGPCKTNITAALQQAADHPAMASDAFETHVVLVTDGSESGCGSPRGNNDQSVAIIQGMLANGSRTYVIGMEGQVNKRWLTTFAEAGGTAIPEAERDKPDEGFLFADDASQLTEKLGAVVGQVVSCTFQIDEIDGMEPTEEQLDPMFISAFLLNNGSFDGAQRLEHGADWTLNGDIVSLGKDACDRFVAGRDVFLAFDCPETE